MERLRSAEDRRQRLDSDSHDVVERLLCLKRDAARLRVKAKSRARVAGAEARAHETRIEAPSRAKLRDLLEQVVMRCEKERQSRGKSVDRKAGVDGAGDVLHR